ncbi:MAG: AI-2E family transporter [Nitrospirae bacterium]|nr:AI-2E family transporter [Nitrospirota bacterium]
MIEQKDKYIEHLVSVLVLSIIIIGCFFVLRPFLSALLWAVILSFSTWPIYKWWEKLLKGRKTLAATIMTLLLIGAFVLPIAIIGLTFASEASTLTNNIRAMLEKGPPQLPAWLVNIPVIGPEIQTYWNEWTFDHERLADILLPYIKTIKGVIIEKGALMGQAIFQIVLSIIVCFFFYRDGEETAQSFANFLRRIAGTRADRLISVAASTTKGVVYGVLGTAAVQGTLAGIGFFIAGVPAALLLGLFTFFLALVPMGPPLLWIPVTIWLFYYKSTIAWIFMLLWGTFIISGIDNIVKPILISQGIDLPFILILLGVFGGIFAFGFIGIFLGPTLLALGYSLISEWTSSKDVTAG